ncbi:MAG: diaminopimelate decarboxylase [Acetobacteraceae bacterium]|jgi:diaminopimelate decarboxylase|nr:diaminopimelate decarboxylase [Acetobacteraceae bacterium]
MAASSPSHDPATDPSVQELIAARPWLRYHAMDGLLLDDVPLAGIADAAGTPTWVYSAATMRVRYRALAGAMADAGLDIQLHYAVKANDSRAVLALFGAEGAGADVVSGGELRKARRAGIPASHIIYAGVGKSAPELRLALSEDIGQFNVESAEELEMLSALATAQGRVARVALRVNPDVDAGTNDKIATGRATDKFGIPFNEAVALYAKATAMPGIETVGLATHIGSQILGLAPYRDAFTRIAGLVRVLRQCGLRVDTVDCGGGLGIPYRNQAAPSAAGFAAAIKGAFHNLDVRLAMEPGRWLVGPAGLLLASVVLVKQTPLEPFVVLDAAMNDLVRPSMYDAWHGIVPVSAVDAVAAARPCSIVGPVCESGDTFARSRSLPPLAADARVAILDAGAYGAVMSSTYNARPMAAEVWVDNGRWSVIRERQPIEALWERERLPT